MCNCALRWVDVLSELFSIVNPNSLGVLVTLCSSTEDGWMDGQYIAAIIVVDSTPWRPWQWLLLP